MPSARSPELEWCPTRTTAHDSPTPDTLQGEWCEMNGVADRVFERGA